MSIPLPPRRTRPAPSTSLVSARARSLTAARGLAFFVALLVLLASLSAEAKKKKGGKKHKPPAAGSKSKSTSDRGLPPPDESASDEEDEKPASKKAAPEADEAEEKKAPPPAPEPEEDQPVKKPAKAAKAPPPEEGAAGAVVLPALQLGLGGTAMFRNLVWTQDGGALAPYSLTPGPEVSVWAEAYPAAFATDGFAANIGLFGRFNYGIGASSKTPPPQNQTLTTKYQDFLAGLKIRIPVGSVVPYVAAAYGLQTFKLTPPPMAMDRPNFTYGVVHLGGGARIYFTPTIDLDVSAGYLLVQIGKAAGEVGGPGYYPAATAYGVDAGASLGFRITGIIGIRAGVDLRQIGMSLHWKMNDPSIKAGGAVDRYIGVWGGLEIVLDGVGAGGGGESEAPPPKKPAKAKKAPPPDESEGGGGGEKEETPSDVE